VTLGGGIMIQKGSLDSSGVALKKSELSQFLYIFSSEELGS
jgi:hypothetical protein